MKILIKDVKSLCLLLAEKLESDGVESVNINTDYYWMIPTDEWANIEAEPKAVVGSLIDDWDALSKVRRGEVKFTYLDIERFASILRAISEEIVPTASE